MIWDCIIWSLVNFHIDILHEMISLHCCLVCIMWWLKYWLMQSWCKSLNHWFLSFFLTLTKGEKVIASSIIVMKKFSISNIINIVTCKEKQSAILHKNSSVELPWLNLRILLCFCAYMLWWKSSFMLQKLAYLLK